jgi:hypothetical protein
MLNTCFSCYVAKPLQNGRITHVQTSGGDMNTYRILKGQDLLAQMATGETFAEEM